MMFRTRLKYLPISCLSYAKFCKDYSAAMQHYKSSMVELSQVNLLARCLIRGRCTLLSVSFADPKELKLSGAQATAAC